LCFFQKKSRRVGVQTGKSLRWGDKEPEIPHPAFHYWVRASSKRLVYFSSTKMKAFRLPSRFLGLRASKSRCATTARRFERILGVEIGPLGGDHRQTSLRCRAFRPSAGILITLSHGAKA